MNFQVTLTPVNLSISSETNSNCPLAQQRSPQANYSKSQQFFIFHIQIIKKACRLTVWINYSDLLTRKVNIYLYSSNFWHRNNSAILCCWYWLWLKTTKYKTVMSICLNTCYKFPPLPWVTPYTCSQRVLLLAHFSLEKYAEQKLCSVAVFAQTLCQFALSSRKPLPAPGRQQAAVMPREGWPLPGTKGTKPFPVPALPTPVSTHICFWASSSLEASGFFSNL